MMAIDSRLITEQGKLMCVCLMMIVAMLGIRLAGNERWCRTIKSQQPKSTWCCCCCWEEIIHHLDRLQWKTTHAPPDSRRWMLFQGSALTQCIRSTRPMTRPAAPDKLNTHTHRAVLPPFFFWAGMSTDEWWFSICLDKPRNDPPMLLHFAW